MAPLHLLLTCTALAAAEVCVENCDAQGDQTALLQSHVSRKGELTSHHTAMLHFPSLGNLRNPKHRRSSLAQFEQTATSLLKDRASVTPAVQELCGQIIGMLEGDTALSEENTVAPNRSCITDGECGALGSVMHEHDNDEQSLYGPNGRYIVLNSPEAPEVCAADDASIWCQASRLSAASVIWGGAATVLGSELQLSEAHKDCRNAIEDGLCIIAGQCREGEDVLKELFNQAEADLVAQDLIIHNDWCTEERCDAVDSGTTTVCNDHEGTVFRSASKVDFIEYNDLLALLTAAETAWNNATGTCSAATTVWMDQRAHCNEKQTQFEEAACQHEEFVIGHINILQSQWDQASTAYSETLASVQLNVADRKVEWKTIIKVICLLSELANPTGDTASDDSSFDTAAIANCHSKAVSTVHLDIISEDVPDLSLPDASSECDAGHTGSCTCSDPFNTHYYSTLANCGDLAQATPAFISSTNVGAHTGCVCLQLSD